MNPLNHTERGALEFVAYCESKFGFPAGRHGLYWDYYDVLIEQGLIEEIEIMDSVGYWQGVILTQAGLDLF